MNNNHVLRILNESALNAKHDFDVEALRFVEANNRSYGENEFIEFKRDLLEAGSKIRMLFMEYALDFPGFMKFLEEEEGQILFFQEGEEGRTPVLQQRRNKHFSRKSIGELQNADFDEANLREQTLLKNEQGEIIFFVLFPYQSLISEYSFGDDFKGMKMNPVQRFLRLLSTERKDILYILFYSVVIGLLSLVLPLGIQTTVELISGGVFFSSVYVLIAIVIAGVLLGGGLQIAQISLVEHLQRRIFTKASIEFAFRIPRLKMESILGNYAPELVNRFFDILTIQKGLPKLLIDLSSGVIQIFFGLLLLSLYHPFFVFFSVILLSILGLIFYMTGPSGLESSINESKYKYKVAQWLEELARAMNSFKLAGNTDLPLKKTDYTVNNYLKYRKKHFSILVTQFSFIILFKAAVTGGLLIMGTILVVSREITLGQFVASEVIIILILAAVEKIIMYMDVVYDLFTAVDKISHVTDLPLEKVGGIDFPKTGMNGRGYAIEVKDLRYRYPDGNYNVLNGIDLSIKPGERVCIAGPGDSGKTTFMNIIAGLQSGFDGIVTINNYSIRDLDLTHLRDKIAKNISAEDIFDGTILENITIGKPMESIEDAVQALQDVGADDTINRLAKGLNTHLVSGGKGYSSSMINKIILARCLAKKPHLIILNDFFSGLKKQEKISQIQCVTAVDKKWTLLAVSNDPMVMAACDRVVVLKDGRIEVEGTFRDLFNNGSITNYLD
ncbi:MAG: ABC transporter ATP-binding protein/permease [Cyclobacteriaceae bacterium]|nr:ABC transporter ATP-binding protein/permease [Cyclobacteriaceae bacterium]MDH4295748.1 ABC transporter ATP-binding protein/permease [Cyclobacteriaceae bacterium]MDH5249574.1 ABC transporter ATP-binding protein/permease [Cyclobacteriaceae bacterium]